MHELYNRDNLSAPAYQLRFSWTGWPSQHRFPFPSRPCDSLLAGLSQLWEGDGIRLLESQWLPEMIQCTVSVTPDITPIFIAARLKGRIDHALRRDGTPIKFSRKLSLCSLGSARRSVIEAYVENQAPDYGFVDARTEELFARYRILDSGIDLRLPVESCSGRYWYNLHVVLELHGRESLFNKEQLRLINDCCAHIAEVNDYAISRLSPMPNHLHLALRGNIQQTPEQIALAFMNTLADSLGQKRIWRHSYYVGTFGEYDMAAVRPRKTLS